MTTGMLWTALLLDIAVGDPQWLPHPVRFIGLAVSKLENFVRRWARSERSLRMGGAFLTLTVVVGSFFVTWLVLAICSFIFPLLHWVAAVVLAYTTLAVKALYKESWIVVKAVRSDDLEEARRLLSRVVSRDTSNLDRERILTAVIETIAENISDGIIAPLFYLWLGGVPLAMAFKAASTIDSMLGYKDDPFKDIGWFGARCDDLFNFVPARITALLLVASAAVMRLDYRSAWRIWRRDAEKHASPNAGHPEAAMAGALNVRLGGPGSYFGQIKTKPYLGDPGMPASVERARQAERLLFTSTAIMALITGVLL
jgi:adenosylcobinamide-phosphate synthase